MTIETSPANDLFAGFNDEERKMIAVAVRRVDELEETRRVTAGMAGQAQAIESDLKARGVTDSDVFREAAEAVAATQGAQSTLAGEVQDYRKLFGPDGKASAAVGQYAQLLRNAHAGDVNALNQVQSARRELYEARDASAQHREPESAQERYQVNVLDPKTLTPTAVLATSSALEAHEAFHGNADRQVIDTSTGKLVGYQSWEQDGSLATWKTTGDFGAEVDRERSARVDASAGVRSEASPNEITRADPERTRPVEIERTEDEKQRLLNPETAALRQDLSTALPAAFAERYIRDGNKIVDARDAKHVILIDKGSKLQLPRDFDAESVKAAVDVAEARGWGSMNVAGDPKFRQAVWVEAATRGIDVKGYKPTEAEQAWSAKLADRNGKTNTMTENDAVKAFRDAQTPAERRTAATQHPELKKAFAIEASYSKLAKSIEGQGAQEAFMKRMRENIAVDLAQGRELADIRLRRPMFKQQEYSRDQGRDQDRGR